MVLQNEGPAVKVWTGLLALLVVALIVSLVPPGSLREESQRGVPDAAAVPLSAPPAEPAAPITQGGAVPAARSGIAEAPQVATPAPATAEPRSPGAGQFRNLAGDEISEGEARWMHSKGFPMADEYQQLVASTNEQLKDRAARGDLVARALLGTRLRLRPATAEQGQRLLEETAADGSIFALHELHAVHLRSDPIKSVAYLNAALALGDWQAAAFLDQLSAGMNAGQRVSASMQFSQTFSMLNQLSISRRGQPLQAEMRPGL